MASYTTETSAQNLVDSIGMAPWKMKAKQKLTDAVIKARKGRQNNQSPPKQLNEEYLQNQPISSTIQEKDLLNRNKTRDSTNSIDAFYFQNSKKTDTLSPNKHHFLKVDRKGSRDLFDRFEVERNTTPQSVQQSLGHFESHKGSIMTNINHKTSNSVLSTSRDIKNRSSLLDERASQRDGALHFEYIIGENLDFKEPNTSKANYRVLNPKTIHDEFTTNQNRFGSFLSHYHKTGENIDMERLALYAKTDYKDLSNKENVSYNINSPQSLVCKKSSKIGNILCEMRESQDKLKKSYYSYKLDRFSYYLYKVIKKVEFKEKKEAFQILRSEAYQQDVQVEQIQSFKNFRLAGFCFYEWSKLTKNYANKNLQENRADAFYKKILFRKVFYPGLHENMLEMKSQREKIKKTYDEITSKIDDKRKNDKKYPDQKHIQNTLHQNPENDYMGSLDLPKHNSTEEKARRENIKKKIKKSYLNQHPIHHIPTDLRLRNDVYKNETNFEQIRKLAESSSNESCEDNAINREESLLSSEKTVLTPPAPTRLEKLQVSSSINSEEDENEPCKDQGLGRRYQVQNENNSPALNEIQSDDKTKTNQNEHNKPTIEELEERAKKRHYKLLEIKRKHQEIQLKKEKERQEKEYKEKEEERLKRLEEKRKLDQKRREEREALQRKEMQKKQLSYKLQHAAAFHRRILMKNYGMNGLKNLLTELNKKVKLANESHSSVLRRTALRNWKKALNVIEEEREQELETKYRQAKQHYALRLESLSFKILINHLNGINEVAEMHRNKRENMIKTACFNGWKAVLPELIKENFEFESGNDQIVNAFRIRRSGWRAFKAWWEITNQHKKEEFKKAHKKLLWGKVNNWLSEYGQNKSSNI